MNYLITNLTNEKIEEKIIEDVIKGTAKYLNIKNKLVEIILVDNKKIHEINKTYRHIDKETDVISFAFYDDTVSNFEENLGEIYISVEKAHEQSEEYNHSFKRELSFLTVHGLLHLLGYDHMKKEDEEIMFNLQNEILKSIGVER